MAEILTLNKYFKNRFGAKVYKISLNGGMTCPNRDGKLDTRGCIFCSRGGSGDFSASSSLSITEQIAQAKALIGDKCKSGKYIAYFQAFTNTYAPVDYLRKIFFEAISSSEIVGLSIGTRPDCLGNDVLDLLQEINSNVPVFVELGLQSIHKSTSDFIRRGYELDCYKKAVSNLDKIGIEIVTHLIIGLPNESIKDIIDSVSFISHSPVKGVKLQLLHILKGTDLEDFYYKNYNLNKDFITLKEYAYILGECIEHLRKDIVIHRLTGDGPKSQLIAPMWSANKKQVLNYINKYLEENNIIQGRKYKSNGN